MENKRLTWKRDLGGYTDVGLCEGVTVGNAICKLADYEAKGLAPEEIEPVKYGKWTRRKINGAWMYFCSECQLLGSPQWKRCPACEAKMKEQKQEQVLCKECKNLEITGCYGECGKAYKGIVMPNDSCPHGERETNG